MKKSQKVNKEILEIVEERVKQAIHGSFAMRMSHILNAMNNGPKNKRYFMDKAYTKMVKIRDDVIFEISKNFTNWKKEGEVWIMENDEVKEDEI